MYLIAILRNGKFTITSTGWINLAELKAHRKEHYKGEVYRIVKYVDGKFNSEKIEERLNKVYENNQNHTTGKAETRKSKLSKFSYVEIVDLMLSDAEYKHIVMFSNKKDAVTHVNNFTSTATRYTGNGLKGCFNTRIVPNVIDDEVQYFVVFRTNKQ